MVAGRLGARGIAAPAIGGGVAGGLGSFPMNDFSPGAGDVALGIATGGGGGAFGGAIGGPLSFGTQSSRQAAGVMARGAVGTGSNGVISTVRRKDGC